VTTTGGTYTLVLSVPETVAVEVGALGSHRIPSGAYAYTGSALGSGGFARVERHRRVAAGDHDTRHWHVDYLTGHPTTELETVVTSGGLDAECAVAKRLPDGPVAGFGASDCACRSHLAGPAPLAELVAAVEGAHRDASEA
jgi:endonuclease-3